MSMSRAPDPLRPAIYRHLLSTGIRIAHYVNTAKFKCLRLRSRAPRLTREFGNRSFTEQPDGQTHAEESPTPISASRPHARTPGRAFPGRTTQPPRQAGEY